jgi:hypothetical protein
MYQPMRSLLRVFACWLALMTPAWSAFESRPHAGDQFYVRPARSIFSNALNFRCSAIAALVRLLQGPLGKLADKDITTQNAINALFPKEPLVGSEGAVSDAVSAIVQRNPRAAQSLVRAYVQSELDKAFNLARSPEAVGFSGPQFAKQVAGNPLVETQRMTNLRAAIEALPNGQNVWDGFNRYLQVMRAMGTRQPIGSRTAFNAADLEALGTGSGLANTAKTVLSPGTWPGKIGEQWTRWQAGRNLDTLAHIITDPGAQRLFARLVDMPSTSGEARAIAMRLSAIGYTSQERPSEKQPAQ